MSCGVLQEMFETLRQQGKLEEQTTQQLYSEAASTFLADRFVSGTCPHADCSYEVCLQSDAWCLLMLRASLQLPAEHDAVETGATLCTHPAVPSWKGQGCHPNP